MLITTVLCPQSLAGRITWIHSKCFMWSCAGHLYRCRDGGVLQGLPWTKQDELLQSQDGEEVSLGSRGGLHGGGAPDQLLSQEPHDCKHSSLSRFVHAGLWACVSNMPHTYAFRKCGLYTAQCLWHCGILFHWWYNSARGQFHGRYMALHENVSIYKHWWKLTNFSLPPTSSSLSVFVFGVKKLALGMQTTNSEQTRQTSLFSIRPLTSLWREVRHL